MSPGKSYVQIRKWMICVAVAAGCATLVGCGGSNARVAGADQAKVTGGLVNGAKQLPVDTEVIFESAEKSAQATGKIDATGKYTLKASDPGVGIPPGRYVVMIMPKAGGKVSVGTDDYKAKMMNAGKPAAAPPSDIPGKFMSVSETPLKYELKAGDQTIDIDLSKF